MSPTTDTYPELDGHVLVVDGYGITIRVQRGHLHITDGAGRQRRERRIPRIGHNISRLLVIGHTGSISLEALRWLDRVGINFTQLDTDGQLLTTSANSQLDDPRLRRAQHLAHHTATGVEIARYLIDTKLDGQAIVARKHLTTTAADIIDQHRQQLLDAEGIPDLLKIEAKAAKTYWADWNQYTITWATRHEHQVPDHWHTIGTRRSPLAGTATTLAVNPINALLNYLYALAEIECRNACLTLGLDPGLGYFHTDKAQRDSLALDLIEGIRPDVDLYVLDLLEHHVFRADDFTERDNGHCRITPPLTNRLAVTLLDWQIAIAPHAEHVTKLLSDSGTRRLGTSSRLTRAANNATRRSGQRGRIRNDHGTPCRDCGSRLQLTATLYCPECLPARRSRQQRKAFAESAAMLSTQAARELRGRQVAQGRYKAKLAAAAECGFTLAEWERHAVEIRRLTLNQIMEATGLGITQASKIKTGKHIPHPRHWSPLFSAATRLPGRSRG